MRGIKKYAANYFIHYSVASVYYLRGSKKIIKRRYKNDRGKVFKM